MNNYKSYNYYCTWSTMEWFTENCGIDGLTPRDTLCDEFLFGEKGLAVIMYPNIRGDLFFMVDDGWEVKSSKGKTLDEEQWLKPYIGSCQLWEEKFPGYGDTYQERLKTLNNKVKALGWKGIGVWISPTVPYGKDVENREKDFLSYWKIRLEWSKYAGVDYWKIDWGDYDISDKYKKALYNLKEEVYPELIYENAFVRSPMNEKKYESGMCLTAHRLRLSYSDVLRTYDVTFPLSIPTTLSRAAMLLKYPPEMQNNADGIINSEDEVYLDAVLGLSMGIMRYDIGDNDIKSGPNIAFGGTGSFPMQRPARRQLQEVERAVRWQRYAPAFSIRYGNTYVSADENCDDWHYTSDQTWKNYFNEEYLEQKAPRVTSRNVNAPIIKNKLSEGEYPYIISSRNPNGSLSLAALGRVKKEKGYYVNKSDIIWEIGKNSGYIGIFGYYNSVEIKTDLSFTREKIYACDLLDDNLIDITNEVEIIGNSLIIDGKTIEKYGLMKRAENDFSEPGMLLRIGEEDGFTKIKTPIAEPKTPHFDKILRGALKIAAFFHIKAKKSEHNKKLKKRRADEWVS